MHNQIQLSHLCLFSIVILIIMMLGGCEEKNYITNYFVENSLTDPEVQPRIVFTRPSDGAIGPFSDYDPYENRPYPRFTIQLNKLVDVSEMRSDAVTLKVDGLTLPIILSSNSPGADNLQGDPNLRHILTYEASGYKYGAKKTYTVIVDTTLEDIHGYTLKQPYIFSFIPEPEFRVYYGIPTSEDVDPINPPTIWVDFNSALNSSIFSKIEITPPIEGEWSLFDFYTIWDSTVAQYSSNDTLEYDTEYTVSVAADARDANGWLIKQPYQFSFRTSPFKVHLSSYSIGPGSGGFTVYNDFRFYFNGLVDTSTVKPAFSVTPSLPYDITFIPSGYEGSGFHVHFQDAYMQPRTTYKMTLDTTVRTVGGVYMKNPYSYSFITGPF